MDHLKAFWKTLHHKINSLSLRERKLIALTSATLVVSVIAMIVWLPLWDSLMQTMTAKDQYQIQIETSQNSIRALELRAKNDVNLPYKEKLNKLKRQVDLQEEKINQITTALIQPERMTQVFKGMLKENKLSFESLKNTPAKLIEVNKDDAENQILFQHGLSLNMQGKFLNGLSYVRNLEEQDWQLYWDELQFKIIEYPVGELKIKVHTLSTSNKVLGL